MPELSAMRDKVVTGLICFASRDAGTLDADDIMQRGRARLADAMYDTERRYEAGQEQPIDWTVAKQKLRERRK